jgi:NAD(P)-dependent dehydrogenase (short-subunit alcohol dehydrogenase family)
MTGRKALILAGTGMLAGLAEALVREGWLVVLPCRRYSPIGTLPAQPKPGIAALRALRPRGHRPQGTPQLGRALWVESHWDRPRELAAKADAALDGSADLLVAWIHEQYRRSVMGACERLLVPGAPVVEVRGVGGPPVEPEPLLAAHPTQLVMIGSISESGTGNRPLAHAEVTEGVLGAVCRAVEGRAASLHQVGPSRPLGR